MFALEIVPLFVTSQATSKSSRSSTGSSSSSQAGSTPLRDVMDRERDRGILRGTELWQNHLVDVNAVVML